MPLASPRLPGHPTTIEALRARAHVVPWLLLAGVIGLGLAGANRGSPATGSVAARAARVEAEGVPTPVSVHCNLRHDFVLRLVINVKLMARSIVLPAHPADPNAGARCLVQMERR